MDANTLRNLTDPNRPKTMRDALDWLEANGYRIESLSQLYKNIDGAFSALWSDPDGMPKRIDIEI